jgi:hypothetical protein
MSSSKAEQEGLGNNMEDVPVLQKANEQSAYPSPPNSPPPTKSYIPKAQSEIENKSAPPAPKLSVHPTPPVSSLQNPSNPTLNENEQEEHVDEADILALKRRLGIEDWRCGCLTQRKTPCTLEIRQNKRDQVDSQIQSMVDLTRSSPDLEAEVKKLAKLVNCRHHDCGGPFKTRIKAWVKLFPLEEGGVEPVLPIERKIREALEQESTCCLGKTKSDKSCRQKMGGQKVQNCAKTIDEIVKPEAYLNDTELTYLLKVLAENAFCYNHKDEQGLLKVASWKALIIEIRTEASPELVQSVPIVNNVPGGPENVNQIAGIQETGKRGIYLADKNSSLVECHGLLNTSHLVDRDAAAHWPSTYDTTPFNIIEKSERLSDYESSYPLVQRTIQQPLNTKDRENGYVYLYEVEGNEGYVKIGYTSRSITIRHEEWEFDCNRRPKILYPNVTGAAIAVQNARRVEALCHAELDHHRIRIYCRGCLKQHIEWFEISAEDAIAVIRKWSNWVATQPYKSRQLRSTETWTLKEDELQRVQSIKDFMEISEAATEPKGDKQKLRITLKDHEKHEEPGLPIMQARKD